jgi:hypothetical protein
VAKEQEQNEPFAHRSILEYGAGLPAKKRTSAKASRPDATTYFDCLYDPWNAPPARYPDVGGASTSVMRLFEEVSMPLVVDGTTSANYASLTIRPNIDSMFGYPTVWNNGVPSTLALADSSHLSAVNQNAEYYRTVALGVEIINVAKRLDEGGILYVRNMVPYGADMFTSNEVYDYYGLADTPGTTVFDMAVDEERRVVWRPLTENPTVAGDSRASSAVTLREADDGGVIDNMIRLEYQGPSDVSADIRVRVTFVIEFVPLMSTRSFFPVRQFRGTTNQVERVESVRNGTLPPRFRASGAYNEAFPYKPSTSSSFLETAGDVAEILGAGLGVATTAMHLLAAKPQVEPYPVTPAQLRDFHRVVSTLRGEGLYGDDLDDALILIASYRADAISSEPADVKAAAQLLAPHQANEPGRVRLDHSETRNTEPTLPKASVLREMVHDGRRPCWQATSPADDEWVETQSVLSRRMDSTVPTPDPRRTRASRADNHA